MEQSTTGHDAVDDGMPSVHRWRVSQLTRLGIPGRWPRCMPTASTGMRSPAGAAWLFATARPAHRPLTQAAWEPRRVRVVAGSW